MISSGETIAPNGEWLVGNPTKQQTTAALWIGSAGLLVLGLQPILLGAMFTEGRTSLDELALIATAEIIMIAVGSAVTGLFVSTRHLHMKSAVLLVLLAVLDASVAYAGSANAVLGVRSLAGLVEGAMVAVSIELIARSRHAERLGGLFVTIQTLAQSVLALILALWVVPVWGSKGGFVALAVVSIASLPIALMVPAEYGPLTKSKENLDGLLTVRSIVALLAIFLFFLFIGSIWAFLEPLGAQYGISAQTVGLLVSVSLAVQVLGALTATWLEAKMDYRVAIVGCGVIGIAASAILGAGPSLSLFWVAVLAIGFIWMFIIPYQIGLAVAADSSRKTALLVPAANLLGAAVGPVAVSSFIVGSDVSAIPIFGICAAIASLVLFGLFLVVSRRR